MYDKEGSSFKFHYVSINSASLLDIMAHTPDFKFHYVSINSNPKALNPTPIAPALNSIMFLLIQELEYPDEGLKSL